MHLAKSLGVHDHFVYIHEVCACCDDKVTSSHQIFRLPHLLVYGLALTEMLRIEVQRFCHGTVCFFEHTKKRYRRLLAILLSAFLTGTGPSTKHFQEVPLLRQYGTQQCLGRVVTLH